MCSRSFLGVIKRINIASLATPPYRGLELSVLELSDTCRKVSIGCCLGFLLSRYAYIGALASLTRLFLFAICAPSRRNGWRGNLHRIRNGIRMRIRDGQRPELGRPVSPLLFPPCQLRKRLQRYSWAGVSAPGSAWQHTYLPQSAAAVRYVTWSFI